MDDTTIGRSGPERSDVTTVPVVPVDPALARHLSRAGDKSREWTARRDDLIRDAVKAGGSLREVAELVGLSHTAVAKIVKR